MRLLLLILILALFQLIIGCKTDGRKTFLFSVEYSSPWGYPVKYILTQNELIVSGVADRNSKKTEVVYKRKLSKEQSDSIYNFLINQSYDTLKSEYSNPNFYDGTDVVFKIYGQGLKSKTISLYMKSTEITDTLEKVMERQVYIKKYQWAHFLKE